MIPSILAVSNLRLHIVRYPATLLSNLPIRHRTCHLNVIFFFLPCNLFLPCFLGMKPSHSTPCRVLAYITRKPAEYQDEGKCLSPAHSFSNLDRSSFEATWKHTSERKLRQVKPLQHAPKIHFTLVQYLKFRRLTHSLASRNSNV